MTDYGGVDDSLWWRLHHAIDSYQSARDEYWSPDPVERELVKLYEEVAQALLSASSNLVSDAEWRGEAFSWAKLVETTDQHGYGPVFDQCIEIAIAHDTVGRLEGSAERCLALAEHILANPPGERVARFLARLGRCYIAGFMTECVMLCRAVLENAVADSFERRGIPVPATESGASSMRTRLKAASLLGWLSDDGHAAAEVVWLRGNKAIHDDPEATTDVRGTIDYTGKVLRELYAE